MFNYCEKRIHCTRFSYWLSFNDLSYGWLKMKNQFFGFEKRGEIFSVEKLLCQSISFSAWNMDVEISASMLRQRAGNWKLSPLLQLNFWTFIKAIDFGNWFNFTESLKKNKREKGLEYNSLDHSWKMVLFFLYFQCFVSCHPLQHKVRCHKQCIKHSLNRIKSTLIVSRAIKISSADVKYASQSCHSWSWSKINH